MQGSLTVEAPDVLRADPAAASALGLATRDGMEVSLVVGQYAVLSAGGTDLQLTDAGTVVFAGKLEKMGAPDVLSIVHSMGRNGALMMVLEEATKILYFRSGTVIFASSTLKDDRLGECLVRAGKITQGQLEGAMQMMGAGVKLGKALVDSRLLSAHELWESLKFQLEEVLISVFEHSVGEFIFVEGMPSVQTELRLSYPMPHYILEGVRRHDEARQHLEMVRDRNLLLDHDPKARRTDVPGDFSAIERDVFMLIDGRRNVAAILLASTWSEHNTTLALARLYRAGWICEVAPAGAVDDTGGDPRLSAMVDRANLALGEICRVMSEHGNADPVGGLNVFFRDLKPGLQPLFSGLQLSPAVMLDVPALLLNLASTDAKEAERFLSRALAELVGFALFTACDQLPVAVSEDLMAQVGRWNEVRET